MAKKLSLSGIVKSVKSAAPAATAGKGGSRLQISRAEGRDIIRRQGHPLAENLGARQPRIKPRPKSK